MKSATAKKPRLWVGAAIGFWLAVGVAVPLMFDFTGDELLLDNAGVIAAPTDAYQITGTLTLDAASGAQLSGGTLLMAAPKGRALTAEAAELALQGGDAVLLLDGSELTIGGMDGESAAQPGGEPGTPPGGASSGASSGATSGAAPLVRALQDGRFKALGMRNGTVVIALPDEHRERLTRVNFKMVSADNGQIDAKGDGFWRGQRTKFTLSTNAGAKDGRVLVKLGFKAMLLDLAYEGEFEVGARSALLGRAKVEISDTERLATALGTSWPIGSSLQDIQIEGPVRWASSILAFDDAKVRVGKSVANGTVSLDTTAKQTLVSSTLAFDELDIAPFLPSGPADRHAQAWQWWNKMVGTLSQHAAPHMDADLRLSAKTLAAGSYSLGPAAATVSVKNGKLSADVAEITLADGRATGQISIDFNRFVPKLTVRGKFDEIATGQWCEKLTGKRHIEGTGRIIADLSSQGVNLQQLVGDLSGQIEFALPRGGAIGLSLVEINSAHDSKRNQTAAEIFGRASRGSTTVSELETVWTLKDGIATVTKASGAHAGGELKFRGKFDIVRQNFDFRVLSFMGTRGALGDDTNAVTGQAAAPTATLISLKSAVRPEPSASIGIAPLEIQLRALTGSLAEIERFLAANYTRVPGQGL